MSTATLARHPAAPAHWDQHAYRACVLCTHGTGPATADRLCTCPAVASPRGQLPVHLARANHGPCGPEATHLHFAGLLP